MDANRRLPNRISLVGSYEEKPGDKTWIENQLSVMNTGAQFWKTYNRVQPLFDRALSGRNPTYLSTIIKNRARHNLITKYNNCFFAWCFAKGDVTSIPFKRDNNDNTINALTINLGDCEETEEVPALCNYDAKDPFPFKGYIPWLIATFTCGMLADFTVTAVVFNKTITYEYNKSDIVFKDGYRVRILVSDTSFLPTLKKYMQNEFVASYIKYYFPSCKDTQEYKDIFSRIVIKMLHN